MKKQINIANNAAWQSCNFKMILMAVIVFGVVVPLFIQIALLLQQSTSVVKEEAYLASRKILYEDLEVKKTKIDALEAHLKELNEIKIKALKVLNQLDKKRTHLQREISAKTRQKEGILAEIRGHSRALQKAKKEISNFQDLRTQKVITNNVYVGVPKKRNTKLYEKHNRDNLPTEAKSSCSFSHCIDYSKCSMLKDFNFHIKGDTKASALFQKLLKEQEFTPESQQACVHLNYVQFDSNSKHSLLHKTIKALKASENNDIVVIEVNQQRDVKTFCKTMLVANPENVLLITPFLCPGYRRHFDYILPSTVSLLQDEVWKYLPPILPLSRHYLLSFSSKFLPMANTSSSPFEEDIFSLSGDEDVHISKEHSIQDPRCTAGWCICGKKEENTKLLKTSKFTMIPVEVTNSMLFDNIIEALKSGCVPVFIGDFELLPFSDTLDWKKAALLFHSQRLPELLFILRSLPVDDLITLKQQGRFFYETYFSSKYSIMRTIIANLQKNIGFPPTPFKDVEAVQIKVFGDSAGQSAPLKQLPHNLSYIGQSQHKVWNHFPGALHMFPVDPQQQPPPSEFQFLEEGKDSFTPIGDGKGGDGVAFSRSLGGDFRTEQFTVLMLTYNREVILMEALQRLSGMKYLNKVVVVWNNPIDPSSSLSWPDIGVEIQVVRTGKNSLNNRFVPYDDIETEAILSMDDDIYLRHDEIELAFRIWRENRDRLVGFPGRHHAYNSSSNYFYYNSAHSCELSLVLTGGAFFHKYYSYVYTYSMENSIKKMVDNYMNCEDIAMNFLVAHITKKPPIKVTSRWTFRCPGCPVALSADADHYEERNVCMKYFQQVYGYNPLRRTQFRADSILFKTRIPSSMTKCFQFV